MSFIKYQAFVKTFELSSLSKAAEALGYTQSGITHMIQGLEKEFGFQLLVRNKRGVNITEKGRLVLEPLRNVVYCNEVLMQTVDKINGFETGTIRIGVFPSVAVEWLPDIIQGFQKDYPGFQIKLMDGDYEEIEQWILNDRIDFGFLSQSQKLTVKFIPLLKDEMMAVISKTHFLNSFDNFPIERYAEEDFVFPQIGLDYDVRAVLNQAGIIPKIKYAVKGDDAIIAMVSKNLGVGMLPQLYLKNHINNITVKHLSTPFYRTIGIGVPISENNKIITERFICYLKKWLKEMYEDVLFET